MFQPELNVEGGRGWGAGNEKVKEGKRREGHLKLVVLT